MKIRRLNERTQEYQRYIIREVYPGGYLNYPSYENETEKYDEYDLDDVIDYPKNRR